MKKAIIFTDDSNVKLPEINRWKHVLGKATEIQKNSKILDALKRQNLAIPGDDINLEDRYRQALCDFIRPARLMFAGVFGEIRLFYDTLKEILPTELYVISGRYGLIREDEEIIPYSAHIEKISDLEELNNRTRFLNAMFDASKDKHFIIMCFPSHYFQFLIKKGWFERFDDEYLFFIVAGGSIRSELSSYENIKLFEKKGVARIGREHQTKILDSIKLEIKFKEE